MVADWIADSWTGRILGSGSTSWAGMERRLLRDVPPFKFTPTLRAIALPGRLRKKGRSGSSETYKDGFGVEHNSPFALNPLLDCVFQLHDIAGERASWVDQGKSVFRRDARAGILSRIRSARPARLRKPCAGYRELDSSGFPDLLRLRGWQGPGTALR